MALSIKVIKAVLMANHDQSRFIDWDLPIVVASSAAGYYIGMVDSDGLPACRFSCEYYATKEEAQLALDNGTFKMKLWL